MRGVVQAGFTRAARGHGVGARKGVIFMDVQGFLICPANKRTYGHRRRCNICSTAAGWRPDSLGGFLIRQQRTGASSLRMVAHGAAHSLAIRRRGMRTFGGGRSEAAMTYTQGHEKQGTQTGRERHGIYTLFFFFVLSFCTVIDRSRNDMTGQGMCSTIAYPF